MPRAIWKGAISFGLVNAPVALYPASQEDDIDFDWLDRRTMDHVGYKRVNKRTGAEIGKDDIVKGVQQEDGEYVLLSEAEIKAAYPKSTQTIEIDAFVEAKEVPFVYLERPYYLEPIGRGAEKVYALLREAMLDAGVIGVARVVMHTKEHLAALIATERALMLDTLRWSTEIRDIGQLSVPGAGRKSASLKDTELKMAVELIASMTRRWRPQDYEDRFTEAIHRLIARKVKSGKTQKVEPLEQEPEGIAESNVIDLSELLKNSLGKRGGRTPASRPPKRGSPARAPSRKRASA